MSSGVWGVDCSVFWMTYESGGSGNPCDTYIKEGLGDDVG